MAEGAWNPAFDSIWRHRKIERLSRETAKIPIQRRHAVAGMFLELMAWARDTVEDGDLGRADPGDLAAAVGLPRSRGAELLAALKASHLVSDDARAHVTGWEDGPGKLVERRRKERQKKADQRARDAAEKASRSAEEQAARDRQARLDQARASSQPRPTDKPLDEVLRQTESPSTPVSTERALSLGTSQGTTGDVPGDVPQQRRREESRREPPTPTASLGTRGSALGNGSIGKRGALEIIQGATGLWREVLEILAPAYTEGTFVSWYARTRLEEELDAGGSHRYVVICPNAFALEWVSKRYRLEVKSAIATAAHRDIDGLEVLFRLEGGPREPDVVELEGSK